MHILEISILSLYHVHVRRTKLFNNLCRASHIEFCSKIGTRIIIRKVFGLLFYYEVTNFYFIFAKSNNWSLAWKFHTTVIDCSNAWTLNTVDFYFGNFGNLERPVHFLKVLVKDIWKTGFRYYLSQKLKICRPF